MTIYNEEYFQNLYESLLNIYIEDKLEMETMNEDFFLLTEDPILLETRKTAMKKTKAKRKLKKAILDQKIGQATQADVDAAELNFVKQQSEAKAKEDYYKGKKAQREIKIARRQPEDDKNPTRYYSAKKAYTDAEKKGNFDLADHINNKNIAQTVQKARKYREIKETGGIDKHVKDVQNAAVNKLAYQKAKDSNRKEEIAKTIAAIDKKADKDSAAIIASSEKSGF